ncbi:hypothetical protein [Kitasatospora sp. MBT66]|uniref:hypothetical protein n=1 Tax=Kitasatospora sp. MBT66 TaxID=1444769 RepID=UPI0011EA6954|nr:hypothetical protein [Kitasatospora sp. MBT66]
MNDKIPEPPLPADARIRVPGAARPVHPPPSLLPPPGNIRTGVLAVAGGSLAVLVLLIGLGGGISFGTDDGGGIDGSRLTGAPAGGSGWWDEPPTPSRTVPTATRTRTPSATPTATITRTPSVSSSVSPSSSWFDGEPSPSPSRSGSATATTTATATPTATPTTTGPTRPDAVLSAYFTAVNTGAFRTAWQLGGRNLAGDYDTFVAGFDETISTIVTVLSVDGAAVTATLEARQTDGTVRHFRGVYTVTDGAITRATVTRTG